MKSTLLYRDVIGGVPLFRAFDRVTWHVLWERPGLGESTSVGESYVLSDQSGTILHRVDARSGELAWSFAIPPRRRRRRPSLFREEAPAVKDGFPSVVDVGGRLVVVLRDSMVLSLDARNGQLLGSAIPPLRGSHLVTKTSVFFLHWGSLSEYDHSAFEEVDRLDYRAEVLPLYRGRAPDPCALSLTTQSVVWNDLSGMTVGVSRKLTRGVRTVWHDHPRGVLTPIACFPMVHGDYLYRVSYGTLPGLYAYRSV